MPYLVRVMSARFFLWRLELRGNIGVRLEDTVSERNHCVFLLLQCGNTVLNQMIMSTAILFRVLRPGSQYFGNRDSIYRFAEPCVLSDFD